MRFPTAALAKLSLELIATNSDIRRKNAELGEQVLKQARSGNLQHDVIGPLVTEVDHLETGSRSWSNSWLTFGLRPRRAADRCAPAG
jgi:hypothetical protein